MPRLHPLIYNDILNMSKSMRSLIGIHLALSLPISSLKFSNRNVLASSSLVNTFYISFGIPWPSAHHRGLPDLNVLLRDFLASSALIETPRPLNNTLGLPDHQLINEVPLTIPSPLADVWNTDILLIISVFDKILEGIYNPAIFQKFYIDKLRDYCRRART